MIETQKHPAPTDTKTIKNKALNKNLFVMIKQPGEEALITASRRHGVTIRKICY